MRNLNKIKDKYQFSLDNRQIASVIGGTLFLGVVLFLAGYFIGGKKCDIAKIKCESDAKNVKIIRQLVKVPVETPVKKEVKQPVDQKSKGVQEGKIEKKPVKDIPKKVVKQVAVKEEGDQNKGKKLSERTSSTIARLKQQDKRNEKGKKVAPKVTPEAVEKRVVEKPIPHGTAGNYVLQVLATPFEREAENLKSQLLKHKYRVFLEQTRSRGTTYYRVRIGYFKDRDEAKAFKGAFEKKLGFSRTFITTGGK